MAGSRRPSAECATSRDAADGRAAWSPGEGGQIRQGIASRLRAARGRVGRRRAAQIDRPGRANRGTTPRSRAAARSRTVSNASADEFAKAADHHAGCAARLRTGR